MVLGLFKNERRAQPVPARGPAGRRIYVIGDIHGRADLLRQMHAMILADAADRGSRRPVVVYLGDYVDRGLESRQVMDLLIEEPLAGFEEVRLLGNHEQAMLDFLEDAGIGPAWLYYGGAATLYSYGINAQTRPPEGAERFSWLSAELARALPPDHLRLRVWERGTGLTKACGTGACAAVVAAHRQGRAGRKAVVLVDGGSLEIEWREGDDRVLMTGPIELEATGELPAA